MTRTRPLVLSLIVVACLLPTLPAQDSGDSAFAFSGDAAVVSKYIWRGQRLTDDWSLQPSMTIGIGGFSFNAWGSMDLTAVNEGDSLFLSQNPDAPAGSHNGLQGKFSEVDYTFSFAHSFQDVSIDVGTIFYTFPERSASLATTTELYGGVSLDSVPFAPSATLYIDVNETGASGDSGIYFLLGAGHSLPFHNDIFPGLDISTSLSFVNKGFGDFYYSAQEAGLHDFSLTFSLPMALGENWSASTFLTYSTLLGDFQDHQYFSALQSHRGITNTPASLADTIWGGITLSLGF